MDAWQEELLVGILSCAKHFERDKAVRETWLQNIRTRHFFLVGRPGQAAEIKEDILFLDCDDSYEGGPQKILSFLRFCENFLDYRSIFKCDNDTYLCIERLLGASFWKQHHYTGRATSKDNLDRFYHWGKTDKPMPPYLGPHLGGYADGGYGYALSRQAVRAILNFNQRYAVGEVWEDKLIGDMLLLSGIHLEDVELGRPDEAPAPDNLFITAHSISPSHMYEVHRKLTMR